jgi:DNA polymerase-3 subunit gamma/tau
MSYQVLARKWRPRTFSELVGQEHVLRALVNALDSGRLHHAFLFTGTRGVGKTTIARILAKSLNCEQGMSSTPCGECATCREIDEGRFVDLIEVDAASRTKVEDTRELLDNVQYAPTRGRYKVYLIDEVHMLSNHSFNALLKTLEEPPPHVKFLLATTDPQRLPVTILSRCLQFNLKRLPSEMIGAYLERILGEEGVESEPEAVDAVARAADGSMRDALSLLDQAIAYGGGRVPAPEVHEMLGTIDRARVFGLLEALAGGDGKRLLDESAALAELAPDYVGVLNELGAILHRIALFQAIPDTAGDGGEAEAIGRLAAILAPEDVQLFYQIAVIGRRDLPLAPEPRTGFEMVLLRMLAFRPAAAMESVPARSESRSGPRGDEKPSPGQPPSPGAKQPAVASVRAQLKQQLDGAASADASKPAAVASSGDSGTVAPPAPRPKPDVAPAADTGAGPDPAADRGQAVAAPAARVEEAAVTATEAAAPAGEAGAAWTSLVKTLPLTGMTRQMALNCSLVERRGERFMLHLEPTHEQFLSAERQEKLRSTLEEYIGRPVQLRIEVGSGGVTPARVEAEEKAERQQAAEEAIQSDPTVQGLLDRFDGELVPGSIRPRDGG